MFRIKVPAVEGIADEAWVFADDGYWYLTTSPSRALTFPTEDLATQMIKKYAPERVRITGQIEEVP